MSAWIADLGIAFRLADAADAVSLGQFRSEELRRTHKVDGTPVSQIDFDVEEAMFTAARAAHPADHVLGEEIGARSGTSDRRWIFDGIDGTHNYALGRPGWATAIALESDGEVVVGVDDGLGAVASWRGEPPDVVVLELGPEGDDRILEKLGAEPRWRAVPALAYASRTLVGWSLPGLAERVDRIVVCGSDRWEDVVEAVRDGVGDMLARVRTSPR